MTRNTKLTLHVRSSCCSKCVTARILLIMVAWTVVMDLFFFKIIFWGFLPLFDRKQGQRDGCDMQRRSPLGSNQGRCNYVACALTIWLLGCYVGMNHYVVWFQWINSCKQMKKKKKLHKLHAFALEVYRLDYDCLSDWRRCFQHVSQMYGWCTSCINNMQI